MRTACIGVLAAAVFVCGCARVSVKPLTKENAPGVRFYEGAPHLFVSKQTKDGKEEYTSQVVYLPNFKRGFTIQTHPGLGSVESGIKLANGWQLSELGVKSDSKIPETIEAVTGLISALSPAKAAAGSNASALEPGLYRIEFDASTGATTGLTRLNLLN